MAMTNHQEFGRGETTGLQPAHHVESTVPVLKYDDSLHRISRGPNLLVFGSTPCSQPAGNSGAACEAGCASACAAGCAAGCASGCFVSSHATRTNPQNHCDRSSNQLRLFFINQICFIGFRCFTFTSHQVFRPITNNCLYLWCPQLVLYWRLYWRPLAPCHWLVRHSRQVPCH